MISIHFIEALALAGFGTVGTDLWYNELPLGDQYNASSNDIAVIEVGGQEVKRGLSRSQLELWGRGENGKWPLMSRKLRDIINYFKCNCICTLPTVVTGCCADTHDYGLVRINPVSGVESLGLDSERNALFRVRFELIYKEC